MSDRGEHRLLTRRSQADDGNFSSCLKVALIVIAVVLFISICVLIYLINQSATTKNNSIINGHVNESIFDTGLVVPEPAIPDILHGHTGYYAGIDSKSFQGSTLGYVTPSDIRGNNISKTFSKKLDIVSPVWFIVRRNDDKYVLTGNKDINIPWMKYMRENGTKNITILPLYTLNSFHPADLQLLAKTRSQLKIIRSMITQSCKKHNFDGAVLDLGFFPQNGEAFLNITIEIARGLRAENLKIIVVIRPFYPQKTNVFNQKSFDHLYDEVDGFSLMTYDYSFEQFGPIAPLIWMKESVEHIVPATTENVQEKRKKILMVLHMFGYQNSSSGEFRPITGQDFLAHLKYSDKVYFDNESVEYFLEYKISNETYKVYYPTLFSINKRIKLAMELGVGIGIWLMEQGLDDFYRLF